MCLESRIERLDPGKKRLFRLGNDRERRRRREAVAEEHQQGLLRTSINGRRKEYRRPRRPAV